MASTIVTKNSSTASAVPLTGDLTQGELAVNVTDKRLFTKNSGGTVVELGTNPASLALPNGTANGVAYLNGSKVVTTGTALTFDGSKFLISSSGEQLKLLSSGDFSTTGLGYLRFYDSNGARGYLGYGGTADTLSLSSGLSNYLNFATITAASWNINGSEQMRLTSTGLGIGTSSPGSKLTVLSTGSTIEAKQSSAGAATYYVMDTTVETNGKRWRFGYTGASGTTPGMFSFLNVTDNVIGPVIDSSGNLGLGVTPSAWNTYKALEIGRVGNFFAGYSGGTETTIGANAYYSTGWKYAVTGASATRYMTDNTGGHYWYNAPSGTAGNAITFTQAMTLDAGGNLLVGTTSSSGRITVYPASNSQYGAWIASQSSGDVGNAMLVLAKYDNNTTTSQIFAQFRVNSSTLSGYITANGANAATFTSSSDIRLKENIEQLPNQLDNICSLNPVEFDFKDGSGHQIGFIAQEMQNVYSDAVAEGPDGYLMISGWSKTEARLVKAIQEQQALITQLTERITALEGK